MITAAAIRKDGIIYTGTRHCFIIRDSSPSFGFFRNAEQGFVTDKGEFLNREEAAKYALEHGQIVGLKFNSKHLFSEDLW
jgi:hypothetical protein